MYMAKIITIGEIRQSIMFKRTKGDIGKKKHDRLCDKLDKWEIAKDIHDKEEYLNRLK
jgi:hypothetical protein